MALYSFHIRKADHVDADGKHDLHVHIYKNEHRARRLLGRYHLPSLKPVFPNEPELNQREIKELAGWLSNPEIVRKLNAFLRETLFNMHKLASMSPQFGEIAVDGGETYINVRVPISKRIGEDPKIS